MKKKLSILLIIVLAGAALYFTSCQASPSKPNDTKVICNC